MVEQKGLDPGAADAIGRYVRDDVEPKFQGQPQQVLHHTPSYMSISLQHLHVAY